MTDEKDETPRKVDFSSDQGDSKIIHGFHTISPDLRNSEKISIESDVRIYNKLDEINIHPIEAKTHKETTIFGATIMLTNICLGATIFTFGIRAKSFGLIWFLISCIIVALINYWTLIRGLTASSVKQISDYYELTRVTLGGKTKKFFIVCIILYSYACIICFLSLLFPLSGRFVQNIIYNNKYESYDEFDKKLWGKSYVKLPFFFAITFLIAVMCLTKHSNKMNFSAYINIIVIFYVLLVLIIQCNDYYNYYKTTKYVKEDKKTYPNWFNLGNAFTSDLYFFKGLANLFTAYACHPRMYPIFKGFKMQKEGLKKMKYSILFSTLITTGLYIISIICSFLIDPYSQEDLILYRKNKRNGKDICMNLAKLLVVINLILTIPGYYFELRDNISSYFIIEKMSDRFNYIFTFASFLGCAIIAAIYDKILSYITYIGGFISVFICYLNPILIYVSIHEKKYKYWKNIAEIIIAIILCIIGIIAGIGTIIDDVKN